MRTETVYKFHVEHYHWLESLRFYEHEICYLKKKLQILLSKNTSEELRDKVRSLQDLIHINQSEMNELKLVITAHEQFLKRYNEHPLNEGDKILKHREERSRMENFEKNISELKLKSRELISP